MTISQAMEIATTHHREGRLAEAEEIYRVVLAQMPDNAYAVHYLGLIRISRGGKDDGLRLIRQSLELSPSVGMFHMNLAGALLETSDLHGAEQASREAIARAVPGAQPHINLGQALWRQMRFQEGLAAMQRAAELEPRRPDVQSFLGVYFTTLRRYDQAFAALQQAIELEPHRGFHYANLGAALYATQQLEESVAAYRRAVALQPDRAEFHADMALPMLVGGNWTEGFKEYEWRLKVPHIRTFPRHYPQPQWDGSPVAGKTVFLYTEQGFGDTVMFCRFAPLLSERGAKVILEVPQELYDLIKSLKGVHQLLVQGQDLPSFDIHSPLLSLPMHFGTTSQTVPAQNAYLTADAGRMERWQKEVFAGASSGQFRVGLVWGGSVTAAHNPQRSLPLSEFAPLAQVPGVSWYSLQVGPSAKQLAAAPPGMQIIDLGQKIRDFADSAAAMGSLDLVICVDTSAAHVAGATGRPVWMLEPYLPYWPWGLKGDATPWYPTMRIFRQPALDNWNGVMARVADALRHRVNQ